MAQFIVLDSDDTSICVDQTILDSDGTTGIFVSVSVLDSDGINIPVLIAERNAIKSRKGTIKNTTTQGRFI